jgi:hypothetical protein
MMRTTWPPSIDEKRGLKQIYQAHKIEANMHPAKEAIKQDPDSINEDAQAAETM